MDTRPFIIHQSGKRIELAREEPAGPCNCPTGRHALLEGWERLAQSITKHGPHRDDKRERKERHRSSPESAGRIPRIPRNPQLRTSRLRGQTGRRRAGGLRAELPTRWIRRVSVREREPVCLCGERMPSPLACVAACSAACDDAKDRLERPLCIDLSVASQDRARREGCRGCEALRAAARLFAGCKRAAGGRVLGVSELLFFIFFFSFRCLSRVTRTRVRAGGAGMRDGLIEDC